MDAFRAWLAQLQFDGVWQTAVPVAASLLCITFHETCHGLAAYRLGDNTAKRNGAAEPQSAQARGLDGAYHDGAVPFRLGEARAGRYAELQNPSGYGADGAGRTGFECRLPYAAVVLCNFVMFLADRLEARGCFWRWRSSLWYVEIISAGLAVFNVFRFRRSTARRFCSRCCPTGHMTD